MEMAGKWKTGDGGASRGEAAESAAVKAGLHAGPAGDAAPTGAVSSWLTRSQVYRRVPVGVRGKVDAAILLRPPDCPTLEGIKARFCLEERYGVSLKALVSYAKRLEQFVRPAMASQVMAGVLGCLPESYRRQLVSGSQVMLVSRVVQALTDEGESAGALSVADLAKLAAVLATLGRRSLSAKDARSRRAERNALTPDTTLRDATQLAEAARLIYGLSQPSGEPREEPDRGAADRP